MNIKILNFTITLAIIFMLIGSGCEDSVTDPPIDIGEALIRGAVTLQDSTPVEGAEIIASSETQGTFTGTSDEEGRYEITVTVDPEQSTTQFTITARKEGLGSEVKSLPIAGNNEIDLNFRLGITIDDPEGSQQGSNIVVVDVGEEAIGIRGSGFNETSTITFEVRDANGIPVDSLNRTEVFFSILGGPGGGEFVNPESAFTNNDGTVKATINSGTESGVVQLLAEATVEGEEFKSSPVLVTIHGGLPNQDHFTVSSEIKNIAGYDIAGVSAGIGAQVGDKDGNPVPPGTPVSFKTTGGIIQASGQSDENGFVTATLYSGNPRPSHPELGNGFATVTASTRGDEGVDIRDSVIVLFSGRTQIGGLDELFTIDPGQTRTFNYIVSDQNGNPLTEGTNISISVDEDGAEDVNLRGDIDVTLPDTQDKGRWTEFSFTVTDLNPDEERNKPLELIIEVTSQNGNEKRSVMGVLVGQSDVPPSEDDDIFKQPHNIELVNVEHQSISVIGTGSTVSSRITFRVVDMLNRPINIENQVEVNFNLSGPGGGEELNIQSAETDQDGRVSTVLTSGTVSGVAQVGATTEVNGNTITAQPIKVVMHAGLPVQENFYIYRVERKNYPHTEDGMEVVVQVGDRYQNPVQEGTAVYFTASEGIGIIQAESWTDGNGFAEAIFWGRTGTDGFGTITASTRDEGGNHIEDNFEVLVSESPVIEANPDDFTINAGQTQSIDYSVSDINGNPMAEGQTINVSLSLPPVGADEDPYNILLMGDTNVTMPDTQDPSHTQYSFSVGVDDVRTFNFVVRIETSGPNGSAVKTITGRANP